MLVCVPGASLEWDREEPLLPTEPEPRAKQSRFESIWQASASALLLLPPPPLHDKWPLATLKEGQGGREREGLLQPEQVQCTQRRGAVGREGFPGKVLT